MILHKLTPSTCLFQSCTSQSTIPRCLFLPHLKSYYLCVCVHTHTYTNTYTYMCTCICICIPQGYNYKYSIKWFFSKISNLDGCATQQLQGSTFGVKGWSHTQLAKQVASGLGAFLRQWPWKASPGSGTVCRVQWMTLGGGKLSSLRNTL